MQEGVFIKELELELELIRVAFYPDSVFKYQLIYNDKNSTGVAWVYSFDEEWYYLYKGDEERYKVKRRKDLEGIKPTCVYKQQLKRNINRQDEQETFNRKDEKVAEIGNENAQADFPLDEPEHTSGMKMGGM